MELQDELEDIDGKITKEKPRGDKVQVHTAMKEFLCKALILVNNAECRQLRQQYIIPDSHPFYYFPSPGQRDGQWSAQRT